MSTSKKIFNNLLIGGAAASTLLSCAPQEKQVEQPNILWIYIEDICPILSCYGETINPTPNIDRLAENGVMFTKAFTIAPVCSPTRSGLITGNMPTTTGTHNHHSSRTIESSIFLPDGVRTVPEIFKEAGYYTFNNGKDDYNFVYDRHKLYDGEQSFHFWYTKVGHGMWNDTKRKEGQPFFGQIQLEGGKHTLQSRNESYYAALPPERRIDRSIVEIPPYYPDITEIREDWARHYDGVRITDDEVGQILDQMEKDGVLDNTIIFFFSDHGYKGIRHKQFCYDGGLQIPLIVSYFGENETIKKQTQRGDLVSLLDVAATSLGFAGIDVPDFMESKDMFAEGYKRDYVISVRDRCDFTIDRIRSVRSQKYKYIKNFMPERSYTQPTYRDTRFEFVSIQKLYNEGKLNDVQAKYWLPTKPEEELFDLEKDPHEINNLANDPAYTEILKEHRTVLENWIKETDDKGQYPEVETLVGRENLRFMIERWGSRCVNSEFYKVRGVPMPGAPDVVINPDKGKPGAL